MHCNVRALTMSCICMYSVQCTARDWACPQPLLGFVVDVHHAKSL